MTALKVSLLLLFASASLIFGLMLLDADGARFLQSFFGYYLCLGAFTFVALGLWQERQGLQAELQRIKASKWLGILAASGLASYFVLLHEPTMLRVFSDEPGHLATAQAMAGERAVFSPQVGFVESGSYHTARPDPIYRMYAYPFAVSLLHNVTGERMANGFILNGLACFAVFVLVYFLGRAFGGSDLSGYAAQALLLTSPLLAQVANSGAYDLFNLMVLAAFALSCLYYGKQPGCLRGLNLCLGLGLLLAYCRNESILFLFVFIGIFVVKTWQARRLELTWLAAFSPLLLLGPFAARVLAQHLSASFGTIYEFEGEGFFGTAFILPNLQAFREWMVSWHSDDVNALLINYLFCVLVPVGLALSIKAGWRGRGKDENTQAFPPKLFGRKNVDPISGRILLGFLCIILLLSGLTMAHIWVPVDMAAVRFFLPLILFMILTILWAMRWLAASLPAGWQKGSYLGLMLLAVGFFWSVTMPKAARAELSYQNASAVFAQAALDWVEKNDDGRTLYVVRAHSLFILHEIPCVGFYFFSQSYHRIDELVARGLYDSVIVFEPRFFDPAQGGWSGPLPRIELPTEIEFETLATRRGYLHGEQRVRRVLGWRGPEGGLRPLGAELESPKFENEWELFERLRLLRGTFNGGTRP